MNVNQVQSDGNSKSTQLKKELRQRKYISQNDALKDIKPFRSYRKQIQTDSPVQEDRSVLQPKDLFENKQVKLKRQYLVDAPSLVKWENTAKQSKYKYDISGKDHQNQQTSNQISQSIKKSKIETVDVPTLRTDAIRRNIKTLQTPFLIGNSSKKKQVQSIIFDSKVKRFQEIEDRPIKYFCIQQEAVSDRNILAFQQRATKVNEEIQAGLINIEKMIEDLKRKRAFQSQIQIKQNVVNKMLQLQKQFAHRRAEYKQKQVLQKLPKEEDIKQELISPNLKLVEDLIERQKEYQHSLEKASSPIKGKEDDVTESHIQLQGQLKSKSLSFPPEYTTFINRLSIQIEKDIQFTNKINDLTKSNQIKAIKSLILTETNKHKIEINIDQSFFQIQASEVDPLDHGKPSWFKKLNQKQLQQKAIQVYNLYKLSQNHFNHKLNRKYSQTVVELLFQELTKFNFTKTSLSDSNSVTVGHLLSYLNMRTNRSFRNRSFVKMIKRLSLKPNNFLTVESFRKLIKD